MHRIAENGIAAHWKYKEGISGKTDMDSKLEWVRQLLDTQTNIIDTDDFFNTLKFDLFEEEVSYLPHKVKLFHFLQKVRLLTLLLQYTRKSDIK